MSVCFPPSPKLFPLFARHGAVGQGFVFPLAILLCVVILSPFRASGDTAVLYRTDFESFPLGDDQLVGNDGWEGDNVGEGVHGTDNVVPGLGQHGFIGFNSPSDTFVSVFRPVDYDPVAADTPRIEFFAAVGIQESTVGGDDFFYITVLNSARQALAAIRFRVTFFEMEIWRFDGVSFFPAVLGGLPTGVVEPLLINIDFEANTWTASWGEFPLFTDETFSNRPVTRDLGAVAAEWQIAEVLNPGNNWMLFDEWSIEAVLPDPPKIMDSTRNGDGSFTLTWLCEAGVSYRVDYSPDLSTWFEDLTGSTMTAVADGSMSYTDMENAGVPQRYYRIARLPPGTP